MILYSSVECCTNPSDSLENCKTDPRLGLSVVNHVQTQPGHSIGKEVGRGLVELRIVADSYPNRHRLLSNGPRTRDNRSNESRGPRQTADISVTVDHHMVVIYSTHNVQA